MIDKNKIEFNLDLKNIGAVVYKIIQLIESIAFNKNNKLSPREKSLFTAFAICHLLEVSPYSEEEDAIFDKVCSEFSISSDKRRYLFNTVAKKGWVNKVGGDYEFPYFINNLDINNGSVEFNINLKWE